MKKVLFILILSLIVFSCKKKIENTIIAQEKFIPGELSVGFKENISLKASFDLVNTYGLEITDVWGQHYISDLPDDSIDYVIKILKAKPYTHNDIWNVNKNGDVFNHYSTGKITVVGILLNMGETYQKDWYKTVVELKLVEQPSVKVFYLKVPVGYEKFLRDKFRSHGIVKWAELNEIVQINPWP